MLRHCLKKVSPTLRYFQKPARPPRIINGKQYPVTDEELPPKYYYKAPYIEDHWPNMSAGFPSHDHHQNPFLDEARKSQDMWEFQYTYEWYESPNDPKSGLNHSAFLNVIPFVVLIWIYSEANRVNKLRIDKKIDSNLWISGRDDISNSFKFKF